MIKKCKQCNKEFETNNINAKYCCRECLYKTLNKKISLRCLNCGKEFSVSPYHKNRKYCCKECANNGQKLKKGEHTKKWNRIKLICKQCGKEFEVQNYRKNEAMFCSRECAYKYRDNGISTECEKIRKNKDYKIWREMVFERDNWTCQKCLERGFELNAHHIENFSNNEELRFNIDNGITLCRECHYKFHKVYGFNNNNIFQLKEFLSVAQEE